MIKVTVYKKIKIEQIRKKLIKFGALTPDSNREPIDYKSIALPIEL